METTRAQSERYCGPETRFLWVGVDVEIGVNQKMCRYCPFNPVSLCCKKSEKVTTRSSNPCSKPDPVGRLCGRSTARKAQLGPDSACNRAVALDIQSTQRTMGRLPNRIHTASKTTFRPGEHWSRVCLRQRLLWRRSITDWMPEDGSDQYFRSRKSARGCISSA